MLKYDPNNTDHRKTKIAGWVPGRSIKRPTRRKWEAPFNARSMPKVTNRQRFGVIAMLWALVDQPGIAAWQAAVPLYAAKASADQKMPTHAFGLFMYVNMTLLLSGSPIALVPPTPVDIVLPAISDLELNGTNTLRFTLLSQAPDQNWRYRVQISKNVSPGVRPTVEGVQVVAFNRLVIPGPSTVSWAPLPYFLENKPDRIRSVAITTYNTITGQVSLPLLLSASLP